MRSRLFFRRSPLCLKLLKEFYEKPPILEALPTLSALSGFFRSREFLRRSPLFLKFLKRLYEKPPILEAFPPFP